MFRIYISCIHVVLHSWHGLFTIIICDINIIFFFIHYQVQDVTAVYQAMRDDLHPGPRFVPRMWVYVYPRLWTYTLRICWLQDMVSEELQRWRLQFTSRQTDLPSSCAQAIKQCDRANFLNVYTLLKLACTIPLTSCECERSFSALRHLQTYTRCAMGQERLSGLAHMHMHYDVNVDLYNTVSLFSDMQSVLLYIVIFIHRILSVHMQPRLRHCRIFVLGK